MRIKAHVIRSCRHLLAPLVRFLLRHGVTWSEFAEQAKASYVEVARAEYGLQGRPTNNARVALLTGLSRREVARVRDELLASPAGGAESAGTRIAQILTAWHVDPEFVDENGRPKDLPTTGPTGSMSSLLKRYAGDLPHRAISKEMQQRELIEDLGDGSFRVLRRDYVYSTLDPEMVQRMSTAIHDHASTLEHNLNEDRLSMPRFEAMADNASVRPEVLPAFQKLIADRGMQFLEEADAWLTQNEVDTSTDTAAHTARLGVGVYLIYDESSRG